jgi:hypothetical protein
MHQPLMQHLLLRQQQQQQQQQTKWPLWTLTVRQHSSSSNSKGLQRQLGPQQWRLRVQVQ